MAGILYYSASTGAFYQSDIHSAWPVDVVELTRQQHLDLIAGQAAGQVISPDSQGRPILTDPPDPTPEEALELERATMQVTPAQLRVALHNAGWLAGIETAVAAADVPVQIAWEKATFFPRNSPSLVAIAAAVGLSPTQMDDVFRAARAIEF